MEHNPVDTTRTDLYVTTTQQMAPCPACLARAKASCIRLHDAPAGERIMAVLDDLRRTLLEPDTTNELNPVRVFSTATPVERIAVHIDDQLTRMDGNIASDDDEELRDLIVQLILLRTAQQATLWNQWADDSPEGG